MRRKTICSLAAVFALCAAALVALVCTQIEYDNEYDQKSPNYIPPVITPPPTGCQQWGEWEITNPASCTSIGTRIKSCTQQGTVHAADSIEEISKLPEENEECKVIVTPNDCQQWGEWEITNPASCTSIGIRIKSCTQQGTVPAADSIVEIPMLTGEPDCPITITKHAVTVTGGTGSGEYEVGATVTITAIAQPGKQLVNWTSTPPVAFNNANNTTTTFPMIAQAVAITANFEDIPPNNYGITVTNNGGGIANADVKSSPANEIITLTAQPNPGWNFVEWQVVSGGVTLADSTKDTTTFTMQDSAVTVNAVFEAITYNITYTLNGGTVYTANPATYTVATPAFTLTNPTRAGYKFTGWTGSNVETPQETVTIPAGSTGHKEYTANWSLITYIIMFDPNGGSVNPTSGTTGEGGVLASEPPIPTRYGYTFNGWFDAKIGGTAVGTTTVFPANATIYAQWTIKTYTLTTATNTVGGGVGGELVNREDNTTTHEYKTSVQVEAKVNDGYRFTGWTVAENTVSTEAMFAITIDSNTTLTANFIKTYTLTVGANFPTGGKVTRSPDSERYDYGTDVKVTAEAASGYVFNYWIVGAGEVEKPDTLFGIDTVITINMIRDSILTAHFMQGFKDVRDGRKYRAVTIGTQTWMAENLNYAGFDVEVGVCSKNESDNCVTYGRLYNWNTAMAGEPSSSSSPSGV